MALSAEEAYAEARRRIAEARATRAEMLDLGDLGLKKLPRELGDLLHLRVLMLGRWRLVAEGESWGWEWDSDRPIPALSDVSPLAGLANLTTLDLSRCPALSDVSPLAGLANLTTLDLSDCGALSDVSPLAGLANLTTLDLSRCPALSDVSPLAGLANLTTLDLSDCPALSDVSPLAGLANLTTLDLSRCGALSDVSPLAGLANLTELKLSVTALSDVSPLAGLANLTTLNLSRCPALSDVSPLAGLANLTELRLTGCKRIRSFAPLRVVLEQLDVLYLYDCNFADLPTGVCGSYEDDNVLKEVRAYYADLEAGAEADAEVKLFVLGNGRVGKTQLVRRLRDEVYDERVPTTHGVEWHNFSVTAADGSPVRVNLWDFGGQDIYHGSHALFLDSHAVFVVLWHPDFEGGTTTDNGLTITNHPLAYWLDYVRAAAGPEAVVLLVQARADTRRDEQPLPPVDLGDLRVRQTIFSAKTGREFDTLRAQIGGAVRDLLHARPPYLIGHGRLQVRNRLRAMLEADQSRPKAERKHRTLTKSEFDAICTEVGGVSSPDALLAFLARTGVVFHNPKLFGGQIILDQQWALDAVYTLLDRARVMPVFRDCGRFTRIDLEQLVWSDYTKGEQETFLGMMEECDICFRSGERQVGAQKEPVYVAPELLHDNPETVRRVLADRVPTERPTATATARFRFLHDGVLRSVLARIGRDFGDRATYWKWGCFLFDERTESRVWLEAARGGADDGPGGGRVSVRVWGREVGGVVEALVTVVNESAGRQKPEWKTDHNDRSVKPDFVVAAHGGDRDPPALVPGVPPDAAAMVAISYGHGDNRDDKGRNRGAFVDGLERAMNGWRYRPLRDTNELTNCGLIREFVLTLVQDERGRPRRVVLVLSDKYLRSAYCMSELYAVWQLSVGSRAAFAERVVPCVIETDLGIDDWEVRANWADHWQNVYDRMDARRKSLGKTDLDQWYDIGQWVRVVSEMLAFVSNMVTDRGYDVLTAHEYAAVRRMLDRPGRGL